MALTPPMVPTTGKYGFDIDENDIEIGIGIHGEKIKVYRPYHLPLQVFLYYQLLVIMRHLIVSLSDL
jgi:hypothetical protein